MNMLYYCKHVSFTGLNAGQTVIVSLLSEDELQADYDSDVSDEFVPYIANPNVTKDEVERLLTGRLVVVSIVCNS